MENRTYIYKWIIAILLVTNIATVASILYHINTEDHTKSTGTVEMPGEQRTKFLKDQLGLDESQMEEFRNINRNYNRSANPITWKLNDLRKEMLEEMAKEQPDENQLEIITEEIGALHKQLKGVTIDFYLQMKSVCNEEQKTKLYQIFHGMLNQEEDVKLPRGGRHGQGRGRNMHNN